MSHDNHNCQCSAPNSTPSASATTPTGESTTPTPAVNPSPVTSGSVKTFVPRVDIVETESAILLTAEMPGVDESGVDITLNKNVLVLQGRVAKVQAEDGRKVVRREYAVGNYERSFTVPDHVDRSAIEAQMHDGLLQVRLPKQQHAIQQKIPVTAVS